MHDRREELRQTGEFTCVVGQLSEELSQSREIFVVVIGFNPYVFNFLLELAEGIGVGALASFQESENALHLN